MSAEESLPLVGFDYTELANRTRKMWRIGDFSLSEGLRLQALIPAFIAAASVIALDYAAGLAVSAVRNLVVYLILGIAAGSGTYVMWGRPLASRLTPGQALAVRADYLFSQPRKISGLASAREPGMLRWQVIFWVPDRAWTARVDALRPKPRRPATGLMAPVTVLDLL